MAPSPKPTATPKLPSTIHTQVSQSNHSTPKAQSCSNPVLAHMPTPKAVFRFPTVNSTLVELLNQRYEASLLCLQNDELYEFEHEIVEPFDRQKQVFIKIKNIFSIPDGVELCPS